MQPDEKLHPVAYANRSLSVAERNYSVTELETLAVVSALTRFHSYLYGQFVTVITDHAAVRAVLETPNPSCKHARWWNKVYGTGLKEVKIVYRAAQSHDPQIFNIESESWRPRWDPNFIGQASSNRMELRLCHRATERSRARGIDHLP